MCVVLTVCMCQCVYMCVYSNATSETYPLSREPAFQVIGINKANVSADVPAKQNRGYAGQIDFW